MQVLVELFGIQGDKLKGVVFTMPHTIWPQCTMWVFVVEEMADLISANIAAFPGSHNKAKWVTKQIDSFLETGQWEGFPRSPAY
jgi:hypothetical protein